MPANAGVNMRIYRQSLRLAEKERAKRHAGGAPSVQVLPPHVLEMAWGAAVRIVDPISHGD